MGMTVIVEVAVKDISNEIRFTIAILISQK